MIGPSGKVYGIDHVKELVDKSVENIMKSDPDLLKEKKIEFFVRDGRKGLPEHAPYDCIHVGAGNIYITIASDNIPKALIEQLANNGVMVNSIIFLQMIPLQSEYHQDLCIITKDSKGELKKESKFPVMFVPLTDLNKQCPNVQNKKK